MATAIADSAACRPARSADATRTASIALDTIDATGRFLHATPEALTRNDRMTWLRIGAPAAFSIREGVEPTSRVVRTVP